MSRRSFDERAFTGLYRLLLRIYPSSFRADFARDMEETFVDRYREARASGVLAAIALTAASAADVITNGLRERIHPHHFGYGMFHWSDVRYSLRLLRRTPAFSALTILTLAGGLGIAIFTFAFLHTAMLAPLPLPGGDRIVNVENAEGGTAGMFDVVDVRAIRSSITSLSTVGAYAGGNFVIGDERHRRVLGATLAEPNMFDVTATRPMLGRTFTAEDQVVGAEQVVVLGYRSWELAFGADTSIVGQLVPLNAGHARIIGVMPKGYGFPVASDAWLPLPRTILAEPTVGAQTVSLYARLGNGASAGQASSEIARLLDRARSQRASSGAQRVGPAMVNVRTYPMAQIGDEAPLALSVLNFLATLILLLACVNVTNLLLARANERARETAVRLALGASRGRLVLQSMWENVIICVAGGLIAVGIAAWGLDAINRWLQSNLEGNLAFWWVWRLDRAAVLSAIGFVTGVIAFLGFVVSARVMGAEFLTVLRDGGARSGNRREGRIARALVTTQVGIVTVLLFFGVMSGVVAYRVAHVDAGYDTRRLLSATVDLPASYDSLEVRRGFYQRLLGEMTASNAVETALLRGSIAGIGNADAGFERGDSRRTLDAASPRAYVEAVDGRLSTIGIALRSGRLFDGRDNERGAAVAIVSQSLAAQYWPGRSPIGQRVRLATDSGRTESREIVGVVGDILLGAPFSRNRSAAAIYVPLGQTPMPRAALLFRHRGDIPAARAALYATLARIDARLAPPDVQTFEEILAKTALIATSVTKLFAICFGFALLLAVSGTYGLMARSIGQRTREIGIRRALGATDGVVARLLVGQGSRQLGVGIVAAVPLLIGIGIGFSSFFPVGVVSTLTSAALVTGAIVLVVLLASYIPARRALALPLRDALWRE